jgi:hypothetical protein
MSLLRSAQRCPVCGADRKACGPDTSHITPVDQPQEAPDMAREKGKLVRVKRTTDSGAEYYEKVRQGSQNKAVDPAAGATPVTSQATGRAARTKS